MFKSKSAGADAQVDTLIGPQVVIRGDFQFSGGLYVEGKIIGSVTAVEGEPATLTLADNGVIEGEVRAPIAIVNGRIDGDIWCDERIELAAKARVQGNVHYRVVEMIAGSILTGRLVHIESMPDEQATVHEFSKPMAVVG